jgi:hypothetical protein
MEHFITGYPGQEHQHRAAMLKVLGPEKYVCLPDLPDLSYPLISSF